MLLNDEIYRMERTILDTRHRVIAKDYVVSYVMASRRREKELEDEIRRMKGQAIRSDDRGLRSGVGN